MAQIVLFGLGLIGHQRLKALSGLGYTRESIVVFEPNPSKYVENSRNMALITSNLKEIEIHSPDFVLIATPHDAAMEILKDFSGTDSRILIEKPMGRNLEEAVFLADKYASSNLSVGFNYRFMPGIARLKNAIHNGDLGDLIDISMQLGHGGAPGDETSWKLDPTRAGGGVILDPGIHLIDLLIYLFEANHEDVEILGSNSWRGFWKTGIDESVTVIGSVKAIPFTLKLSIVQWRTTFRIDVTGTEKYMTVEGRGRSDGPQTLRSGKRWAWLEGKSQIDSEHFEILDVKDSSLTTETECWVRGLSDVCSSQEALSGMRIYSRILERSKK